MATKFIENVGGAAGDAATELARLKGDTAANVIPFIGDAIDGVVKYYDRVNSVVQQLIGAMCPPVTATAATLAVTAALHAGRTVVLNRAAGIAVTLPAATGSGAFYRFVILATASGGNYVVAVANANDYMIGVALLDGDDAGNAANGFTTANTGTLATESDTATMNGTTQGGIKGAIVEVQDLAANIWQVSIRSGASGTEATPFSAAV